MSLKGMILDDLKTAMKARDAARLNTLRMVKAKILEAEVAQRAAKGVDYQLDDSETLRVLSSCAKQRRESIESFSAGGRNDLADQERAELSVIEAYLPKALSEDEVRAAVKEVIAALGAVSKKDLGAVMKGTMAKLAGAADGKLVNRIAGELLP